MLFCFLKQVLFPGQAAMFTQDLKDAMNVEVGLY